ncbi:hypothetical protein [Afipia sp. DC4300-2b1]|uniref:hypothetical protein n=1 Tax=Afipia sp. DC4300-2b1 TaxID=2804672 RepID=UPI003CEDCCCD
MPILMVAPCAPALFITAGAARTAPTPTENSRLVNFIVILPNGHAFFRRPWAGLEVRKTGLSTAAGRNYPKHPIIALQRVQWPKSVQSWPDEPMSQDLQGVRHRDFLVLVHCATFSNEPKRDMSDKYLSPANDGV